MPSATVTYRAYYGKTTSVARASKRGGREEGRTAYPVSADCPSVASRLSATLELTPAEPVADGTSPFHLRSVILVPSGHLPRLQYHLSDSHHQKCHRGPRRHWQYPNCQPMMTTTMHRMHLRPAARGPKIRAKKEVYSEPIEVSADVDGVASTEYYQVIFQCRVRGPPCASYAEAGRERGFCNLRDSAPSKVVIAGHATIGPCRDKRM
jgi:hypothetical protein